MQDVCHRCGGDLFAAQLNTSDGRPPFCPHCGAPQLLLSDYAEPLSTGAEATLSEASSGSLPPPRPDQVDWRLAIRSAVVVAGIAVLLSVVAARLPNLSPLSTIWVISASLTTLALYQRRRPLAMMNAGIGARIGILVGITLAFFLGTALAIGMVVARFGLHSMSSFDNDTAQAMKAQLDQLATTRPIPPESLSLINSLQFRTTMMLTGFALLLLFIFMVSVFGGALAGLLRARRTTAA